MNRRLQAGLAVTLLAAAWAELWPSTASVVPEPTRHGAPATASANVTPELAIPDSGRKTNAPKKVVVAYPPLPQTLASYDLQPAQSDPFAPIAPPAPPAPPPLPALTAPPPPPPPKPPAFTYRFFGAITAPSGQVDYYLTKGDKQVLVKPGQTLDDGFVVDSVTATAIRIRHPLSDTPFDVPLPAHSQQ